MRRVGWQGWANDGVRSMNEIYEGREPVVFASTRLFLFRICSAYLGISAAECKSAADFKAICGSAP